MTDELSEFQGDDDNSQPDWESRSRQEKRRWQLTQLALLLTFCITACATIAIGSWSNSRQEPDPPVIDPDARTPDPSTDLPKLVQEVEAAVGGSHQRLVKAKYTSAVSALRERVKVLRKNDSGRTIASSAAGIDRFREIEAYVSEFDLSRDSGFDNNQTSSEIERKTRTILAIQDDLDRWVTELRGSEPATQTLAKAITSRTAREKDVMQAVNEKRNSIAMDLKEQTDKLATEISEKTREYESITLGPKIFRNFNDSPRGLETKE